MSSTPAPSVPPLSAHLGYWLRYVSNHVSHAFARKVEGRGVTVAEWVVLRELYEGEGTAPGKLAGRLGLTPGAVSKLVARLAGKGLVEVRPDPRDGRGQVLALAVEGRRLVPELAALADANEEEFFGHLSAGERAQIEALLRDIVERRRLTSVPVD